jgi:hypothetical protein
MAQPVVQISIYEITVPIGMLVKSGLVNALAELI